MKRLDAWLSSPATKGDLVLAVVWVLGFLVGWAL